MKQEELFQRKGELEREKGRKAEEKVIKERQNGNKSLQTRRGRDVKGKEGNGGEAPSYIMHKCKLPVMNVINMYT